MSKELKKEELLEWLHRFYGDWIHYPNQSVLTQEASQAYQQIKSLIENQPEVDEKKLIECALRFESARTIGKDIVESLKEAFIEAGVKVMNQK